MNETHTRPWWRLHSVSLVFSVMLASALVYLNLFQRETETEYAVVCRSGWPTPMFEGVTRKRIRLIVNDNVLEPTYPGWRPRFVAANVAASLSIVGAAMYGVEKMLRRLQGKVQFSIRFAHVVTSCIATFVAIERIWNRPWQTALADAALGMAIVGVLATWFGFFEILNDCWNALGSRFGAEIVIERLDGGR